MTKTRSKRILSLLVIFSMLFTSSALSLANGPDIQNHWAEKDLKYMIEKEILNGYPDGTIKPDNNITKAEFYAIINRLMGYKELEEINFSDVKTDNWFYEEVAKGVKAGYIESAKGELLPNTKITRQEVARVLGIVYELDESASNSADNFTDGATIANWAKGYVSIMKDKGYISGYPDGTFKPEGLITRGEIARMITNISGNIVNVAGEYTEDALGNVVVNTPNVTLNNMTIKGNLYLTEGIGEGDVTLDNITVKGETYVQGGGENSIKVNNSKLGKVIINKKSGGVRVVLEGKSKVSSLVLDKGAKLELKKGTVVNTIQIAGKANVDVGKGAEVGQIEVNAKDVEIKSEGKIAKVVAKKDLKVNGKTVKTGEEIKVENGKVEDLNKPDKPTPSTPSKPVSDGGSGGGDGGGYTPTPDPEEPVKVSAITVEGKDKATTITTKNGTLQMVATVSPENASNKSVTWDFDDNDTDTGSATIDTGTGLLTAKGDGTVTVRATAKDGSGVVGTAVITISGQEIIEPETVEVAYTAEGDITVITPDTVTFAEGKFTVPAGVTEFTFKDGEKEMKATFADGKWTIEEVVTEPTTYTVTFSVTPEDATVVVKDSENNEVAAETDGTYKLAIGTYSYTVSKEGYVEQTGELTVTDADKTITIALEEVVVTPTIVSVTNVADVEVDYGTAEAYAIAALAGTTKITDSNAATHTVNLSWTIAEYDGNTAGTYTATGTFELPEGVDQAEPAIDLVVTATVTVKAEVVADKEITAVTAIDDITVDYGTELSAAGLPETVEVTLDDETTTTLAVTWDGGNPEYNGNTAGTYVFKGTLTLMEGIANTANMTATVNVIVAEQEQTALPTITTEAQTVNTSTITIEGTAEANAVITITGGAESATGTADESGNFSIEVALTSDAANNLSVTAQVAGKTVSEAATVAITHETIVEASIESVVATNGTVTITLAAKPTVAPVEGDFTATVAIDGGSAEELTLEGFTYDGDKTVTYTFTPIAQTAEEQSIVVAVKLGEGPLVAAPAFMVEVKLIEYASTETVDFDVTVNFGTSEVDAIAALAKTIGLNGTQGETGIATITWTIAEYNGSEAGDYAAIGVLTLPEGWTGTPTDVTATVTVEEDPVQVALAAVNAAADRDALKAVIEEKAVTLGLDLTEYNTLIDDRKPSVSLDLLSNKPDVEGYDLAKLQEYFNAIVETRLVTQQSMNQANEATTAEQLEGYVSMLLERFQAASEVYTIHSGEALTEKVSTLQGLMERYNKLGETEKTAVLGKVLALRSSEYGGKFARSKYTTDAFATALAAIEDEVKAVDEALAAVNTYLTSENYVYADAPEALGKHLATLGLQVGAESDYAKLDRTAIGGKNRKTAVFYDLNNNKPVGGYDQDKLTTYFNDMVATRLVTEESMDLVNGAENIEALNGISFVTKLLDRFKAVSYQTHSDIPVTEKVNTLQGLVDRYGALSSDADRNTVLQKLLDKRPVDGYARSQATTDALAKALTEVEEGAAINDRLAITSVTIADKGAYDSTAKGTVRVLGYGVGINLDAKSEGKKISDTTSIVIELYKEDKLLGQQTFKGFEKHAGASSTSGTIDAGGQYVATSWDNSWSAGIADIPDKAVATVQYTDGTATAEMTLSFTEEQTKIFKAAEAVHALFVDAFAEETALALKEGVTQDAITAAETKVNAVTVKGNQNKEVLQGLITKARELLKPTETTQGDGSFVQ